MRKRNLITSVGLVSVCSLTFASLFLFNPEQTKATSLLNPGKITTQQRIDNAKIDVEQMRKNPEEESSALVSFNGLKKKEFVRDLLQARNLKVKQMHHAFQANKIHTGGYLLKDGENVDEALATYEKDLKEGLKTQIETMQKNAQGLEQRVNKGATDEKALEDKKALDALKLAIADLQKQSDYLRTNGIEIYGLKVTGKNKDIIELLQNTSVVAIDKVTQEKAKWNPILLLTPHNVQNLMVYNDPNLMGVLT